MDMAASNTTHAFLSGGGETGELTRRFDWSKTSIGMPHAWPQSLRTTLSIILNSKFPMFLFWGAEHLCFYNDAYRPSLGNAGKHPGAIGKPGAEVWPEIWDTIKPLIDRVMAGGEATWSEDQLIPIYRNGRLEDVYWTFSYSPVTDESGSPAGVFVTCTETTQKVITINQLQLSEQRFQSLVREASVGIIVLVGEEMRVEVVNDAYARLIDRQTDQLKGKPLFSVIPEAEAVFRPILDNVRLTGEPLYLYAQPYFAAVDGGRKEGFLDLVYQPYKVTDGTIAGVMVLCHDVTQQEQARQKVEANEQYLRDLTDTVPAILWITEADGHCSYLNRQWYDYTGQTEEQAKGYGWLDATHPDNQAEVERLFLTANDTRTPFYAQYRLRGREGQYRWVIDKASPRFGAGGEYAGMIGTVIDIHDQKRAEEDAAQFKYMADNASDPFILMREDGTFAYLNKLALDRWGYTADEAAHIRVPDVDPIYNEEVFAAAFTRAQQGKIPRLDTLHRRKDGTIYPVEINMGGLLLGGKPHLFAVARDITERKKAEQALRDSEHLFRNVTNSSPTGLWLSDENGGLTYLNNTLVDWTGLPYELLLGTGWANAIIDEDRERSAAVFLTAVASRTHYDVQFRIAKADGSVLWCRAAGDPYYHDDGSFAGYAGFCMDIDELVKQRQRIEASEARLRTVIEATPAAIGLFVGRDMVVDIPNQSFIDIVGKGPDIAGKPLREVMPELVGQPYLQLLDEVFTTGQPREFLGAPANIIRNGVPTRNFYNMSYTPLSDADGQVYAVLDVVIDVTQEIEERNKLEESERFARTLFEGSPVANIVFVGQDMVVRTVNENMLMMLGRDASIVGKPFMEAMPELLQTPVMKHLRDVLATGEIYYQPEEKIEIIKFGQPYTGYYNHIFKALSNANGERYGVMVTTIEVTEQVLNRQTIAEAETTLRGAIDMAELGTWQIDLTTKFFNYSARLRHWFGFDPDEVITRERAYSPLRAEDVPRVEQAIAQALTPGGSGNYDIEYTIDAAPDRRERILHVMGKAFFDQGGQAYKLSGTAQDVTAQRKLQVALEQEVQERTEALAASNEELAAINEEMTATNEELASTNQELTESNQLLFRSNENLQQFAYVASHDLQEPLRKIQSFGDLLRSRYGAELGEGVEHLERMQAAASRMSTLIRDLLAFSRISTQQDTTAPVALQQVITTVLADLDLRIQETGAVIEPGPLPTVPGDRAQLEQLFQNLLSNALKFRRSGVAPLIRVQGELVAFSQLPPTVKPTRQVAVYHRIDVIDNGIGFDDKYVDRIFQVFQRLHGKNEFAGTGIGLAICEKVAANHGGAITATSQPGQGATFSVYLPG